MLYFTFLANVCHNGLHEMILPLPQTRLNAARVLQHLNIKADLIYLEAAHDYLNFKLDLDAFYPCLREGGILFGDDFNEGWPGLVRAVEEFAAYHSPTLLSGGGKFAFARGPSILDVPAACGHPVGPEGFGGLRVTSG